MTEVAKLTPLEEKRRKQIEEKEQAEVVLDAHVPKPVGYRVLIALPTIEDTFEGGIAKASSTIREETILTMVGVVVDMGEQAYNDKERFPSGPWCKEGDFVLVRPHAGTRLKIHGKEFRIINDDSVEGVVEDPRGISRS